MQLVKLIVIVLLSSVRSLSPRELHERLVACSPMSSILVIDVDVGSTCTQ